MSTGDLSSCAAPLVWSGAAGLWHDFEPRLRLAANVVVALNVEMPQNPSDIPEELILDVIEQLQQAQSRAVTASNAVDSVLGFLFTHETRLVPQLTLMKESLSHYRHLAEFFSPPVRQRLEEMLAEQRRRKVRRASRPKGLSRAAKKMSNGPVRQRS